MHAGSIPFWINTFGRTIIYDEQSNTPFGYLTFEVILLVLPYGLGLFIQQFCSPTKEFATDVAKGCAISYLVMTLCIGIFNCYDLFLFLPLALQLKVS